MAITVKEDLVDGANYRERNGRIEEWTRTFRVSGLNGTAVTNRLRAAKNAVGISPGASHPNVAAIKARDQRVRPLSSDAAIVTITYSRANEGDEPGSNFGGIPPTETQPGNVTWEFGGGLLDDEISFDRSFNEITVDLVDPSGVATFDTKKPKIRVRHPRDVLRARVRLTNTYIGDLSRIYKGKVNSVKWPPNGNEVYDRPGTWMCSDITASSDDLGATWITTFEFIHDRFGWQPVAVYTDDETGERHKLTSLARDGNNLPIYNDPGTNGYTQVPFYETADFGNLNLF
jgi:hypothetical protein